MGPTHGFLKKKCGSRLAIGLSTPLDTRPNVDTSPDAP